MNRDVVRQSPNKLPLCCHFFMHLQNKKTSAKLPKKLGQHMWVFDSNKWDSYSPSYPSSYLAQAVKPPEFRPFLGPEKPHFLESKTHILWPSMGATSLWWRSQIWRFCLSTDRLSKHPNMRPFLGSNTVHIRGRQSAHCGEKWMLEHSDTQVRL